MLPAEQKLQGLYRDIAAGTKGNISVGEMSQGHEVSLKQQALGQLVCGICCAGLT